MLLPTSIEEFYERRDKIFLDRGKPIRKRHQGEREFFERMHAEIAKMQARG